MFEGATFEDYIRNQMDKSEGLLFGSGKFRVIKSEEGQIRFLLPNGSTYPLYKWDFSDAYFETTPENFSKLFIKK
jgi:hypothetical protein